MVKDNVNLYFTNLLKDLQKQYSSLKGGQIGGDGALSTLSNTEDGINLGLEVKFYSNKSASEVRKLANSAREYMVGIGFHCDYFSPVENVSDTSISQFLTRFSKLET